MSSYPFESLLHITPRPELVFVEGQGSWLVDHQGKRYLDFLQGWAVNSLGHCHPAIIAALEKQARTLINPSPAFYNAPMLTLAKLLTDHSGFDKVFFANSGAEANEGAIKLARKWGRIHKEGAYQIITFTQSFHGRTLATMSASGKVGWDTLFAPQVPGFPKATFNDLSSVEALINKNTVAVMLEPIQGEGGVIPATPEFMQGICDLTKAHKLLFIVDEVQSGCGRTGKLFAHQLSAVQPDIMTLGKGIGGGVPLSALLCTNECAVFESGDQGGTYNGNPLMCAVGIAVFETLLKPGFLDEVRSKGEYLQRALLQLCEEFDLVGERGNDLLRALILGRNIGPQLVEAARALTPTGLLINAPRPDLLRFMPALNISHEELDQMITLLHTLLKTHKKTNDTA